MKRNLVETIIGAVVLAVAVLVMAFAYSTASLRPVDGYEVTARFDRVDGLQVGSDVRISGIRVGTVTGQALDADSFLAVVRFSLKSDLRLPVDSVAEIASESLLGGRYLALVPGAEDRMIEPGGEITFTQSPVNLENLIGQLIFSQAAGEDEPAGETGK
ncbi:MAG: outer membrane lipid asymmetry maintenance protein MlaD [Alphaproteobacteria bacterium]